MDLTIVIVNWNGGQLLHDCLASLAAQSGELELQVIVVDNASRDGSRERAQRDFPQFTVINSGSNLGFGRANNLARPLVKSDLVLFLNPDTVVFEDSLARMAEGIRQRPEVGILGCQMRYPSGEVQELGLQYFPTPGREFLSDLFLTRGLRRRLRRWLPYLDPRQDAYAMKLYGGCLLCRREALEQVGWFDERYFMYGEDADLCRAVQEQGWKLFYLSSAAIIHVCGGTTAGSTNAFSVLMKAESIAKLIAKYSGPAAPALYRLGTFVAASIRLALLCPVRLATLAARGSRARRVADSFLKHRLLVLWALGWRSAVPAL
jgi:hypothetical protein